MKAPVILLLGLVAFTAQLLAKDPFPRQPMMSAAHDKLTHSLAQLEKSRQGTPEKHRKAALMDLAMAKSSLEQAAKNKGSYGPAAIRLIDEATAALEATPVDDKKTDEAAEAIKKALEELNRGARSARK